MEIIGICRNTIYLLIFKIRTPGHIKALQNLRNLWRPETKIGEIMGKHFMHGLSGLAAARGWVRRGSKWPNEVPWPCDQSLGSETTWHCTPSAPDHTPETAPRVHCWVLWTKTLVSWGATASMVSTRRLLCGTKCVLAATSLCTVIYTEKIVVCTKKIQKPYLMYN